MPNSAIVNPSSLHDPTGFGYSHLAQVPAGSDLVLVAGQYASGDDGHVVASEFADQVRVSFENVGKALAEVGLGLQDVIQIRTFICDHDEAKLHALVGGIAEIWGDLPPVQTLLGVAALALPEMLFEVDAVALRPAA